MAHALVTNGFWTTGGADDTVEQARYVLLAHFADPLKDRVTFAEHVPQTYCYKLLNYCGFTFADVVAFYTALCGTSVVEERWMGTHADRAYHFICARDDIVPRLQYFQSWNGMLSWCLTNPKNDFNRGLSLAVEITRFVRDPKNPTPTTSPTPPSWSPIMSSAH